MAIHLPREVWACIMSFNNQSRVVENLTKSMNASNEFADVAIDNLERASRVNESLFFQLRKLRRKYETLKRRNRMLMLNLQQERQYRMERTSEPVPIIANGETSTESDEYSSDSTIIEIDNDEIDV